MSFALALILSIGACGLAAALEGLCAGRNVRSFFAALRFPRYAAPLWLWSLIGGLYYVIFFLIIFRLLRLPGSPLKTGTLVLIAVMMAANALTNYIIFRAQNLYASFLIGCFFPVLDLALIVCVAQLDKVAAFSLIPYLVYRVYGVWWGYALWKENREPQARDKPRVTV
jgi:tryptophan-rich sensory protein